MLKEAVDVTPLCSLWTAVPCNKTADKFQFAGVLEFNPLQRTRGGNYYQHKSHEYSIIFCSQEDVSHSDGLHHTRLL